MAERKRKAADQAATTTTAKRGRKPAAAKAAQQVNLPIDSDEVVTLVKKEEAKPEKSLYKVECRSVLNVRSGAGMEYPVIKQIPNGSEVAVMEKDNGWGRIGENEWVMLQFLK